MNWNALGSSIALLVIATFATFATQAAEPPAGQHGGPPRRFGPPSGWPNGHPVPEPRDSAGNLVPDESDDLLEIVITNSYDNTMLFGLARQGTDTAHIFLSGAPDGTYRGKGIVTVASRMKLPGGACKPYGYGWQFADVVGVPIPRDYVPGRQPEGAFYSKVHLPVHYRWLQNRQPGSYLRLEIVPSTAPTYSPRDPCQEEIPPSRAAGTFNFIPLNDAQWTIEGYSNQGDGVQRSGYAIALPVNGKLNYEDHTSNGPPPAGLGAVARTKSVWYVTVSRFEGVPVQ
jgi:hypothetical protein